MVDRRKAWARTHLYNMPVEGYPLQVCKGCGVVFQPRMRTQLFHNKACGTHYHNTHRYGKNYETKRVGNNLEKFMRCLLAHKHRGDFLTLDYMLGLYDAQQGRCAISGREMTLTRGQGRVETNMSIDRIDREKGYIPGNVQLVCAFCNKLKGMMSMAELVEFCQDVIDSNPTHNGAANLRVESAEKNAGEHEDSRLKGSKRDKASWGQD